MQIMSYRGYTASTISDSTVMGHSPAASTGKRVRPSAVRGCTMSRTDVNGLHSDDIMTAKGTYALAGSLLVGLMLWGSMLAMVI